MKPIRIFASWKSFVETWSTFVIRELDDFKENCVEYAPKSSVGTIHIGFDNIDYRDIDLSLVPLSNIVFATSSAMHCLLPYLKFHDVPFESRGEYYHLVVSGLGYDLRDVNLEWLKSNHKDDGISSENRLAQYLQDHPELKSRLQSQNEFEVTDEHKSKNLNQLEICADYHWFFNRLDTIPTDTIQLLLRIYPRLLGSHDVSNLGLSTRPTNVFSKARIISINDLSKLSDQEIIDLPSMGAKSFNEIRDKLIDYAKRNSIADNYEPSSVSRVKKNFNERISLDIESVLNKRELQVFLSRSGTLGKKNVLRDIAEELNVSHERIRQLETAALKKVQSLQCMREIDNRIRSILDDRIHPLPIVGLHIFDEWFDGVTDSTLLEYLLHDIIAKKIFVIESLGVKYIADLPQEEFKSILLEVQNGIESRNILTKEEAERVIEIHTFSTGKSLRSLLLAEIESLYDFLRYEGNFIAIKKRGLHSKIAAVLQQSSRPLHYSEVTTIINETEFQTSERMVHATIQKVEGIILFSRGCYGFQKHSPLSANDVETISTFCYPIISEQPSRQWHSAELLRYLADLNFPLVDRLDSYLLYNALKSSNYLSFLNRQVFTLKGSDTNGASRIQVHQAIESLLIDAGKPLTSNEIRSQLEQSRGLGKIFQIVSTDKVARLSTNLWGLYSRDISLSQDEILRITQYINQVLEDTQEGIHLTELAELIGSKFASNADPVLLATVIQHADPSIKFSVSDFLYKSVWGNHRRVTPTEAIRRVFEKHNYPMTTKEIHSLAVVYLGRDFSSDRVYTPLKTLGIKYDELSGKWLPNNASESEEIEESDEE